MSSWTELDPRGSDLGGDLHSLAQVLTGAFALRPEGYGVFLFASIEPVLDGLADATLTIEDGADGPDRAAVLVFPDEGVEPGIVGERLDGVPAPLLPNLSSVWLCERTEAPAQVVLEIRVGADDTRRFELRQIRPPGSARSPSPVRGKRREGPGNLERRSDWFQSGRRRR